MVIKLISDLNDQELLEAFAIYVSAQWLPEDGDCSFLRQAFCGSFLAAGAFEDGRLIGIGRVLSDGCSDAYIQDVAVHPGFRKRGIGGKIVRFLVSELEKRKVDWIALIGEPGTESFYSRLGFEKKEGFSLWKWKC